MKLATSQLLTRLSEKERSNVETELADLQKRKQRLEQQLSDAGHKIQQLSHQRDESMQQSHFASLLQGFELSVREQLARQMTLRQSIAEIEVEKQEILQRLAEAHRTHHVYDKMHQEGKRQHQRREEAKSQRQMDDMIAARSANSV